MAPQTSPVSERVVQRVAAETETDQLDLLPLYEAIDPEALDSMVDKLSDGEVSFAYAGTTVTVDNNGAIRLTTNSAAATTDSHYKGVETTD